MVPFSYLSLPPCVPVGCPKNDEFYMVEDQPFSLVGKMMAPSGGGGGDSSGGGFFGAMRRNVTGSGPPSSKEGKSRPKLDAGSSEFEMSDTYGGGSSIANPMGSYTGFGDDDMNPMFRRSVTGDIKTQGVNI